MWFNISNQSDIKYQHQKNLIYFIISFKSLFLLTFIIPTLEVTPTVNFNQNLCINNFAIYEIKRSYIRSWEHQIHQRLFPMIKRHYKYLEHSQLQFYHDSFLFQEMEQVNTNYMIQVSLHLEIFFISMQF